jgi:hypothetical protein
LLRLGQERDVGAFQHLPAQRVDGLALLVHDVVVIEQALADVEVVALHLASARSRSRALTMVVLDGDVAFVPAAEPVPSGFSMRSAPKMRMRSSSSERKKRELPGVALAAGAAAQLVVDAPGFVAFGAEYVKPAGGQITS